VRTFGKYRLLEPVASGGMAEVWRAEAPGAEGFVKEVALKLIRGDHDARGDFVRMFVQEARLASRLSHANVVQVFDFDQVDGRYYIAMELVRGRTLREVIDRCREQGFRLGLARAVHVCAEVARALAYAHRLEEGGVQAGLVHRDVSPQNVLVSFEGEVKLTDFGIARALGASEVTAPGTVKGKLAYMAPEQARGEPVDGRADVFALGVVLWELCAGRRLFARDTDASTLAALLSQEPLSPPSAWNEEVPARLDEVTLAALERDPRLRTPSADAFAEALAALRLELAERHEDLDLRALMRRLWPDGATSAPRTPAVATAVREVPAAVTAVRPAPAPLATDELPTRTAAAGPPPRRRLLVAGALGALLVAVGGGAIAWRARGGGAPPLESPNSTGGPTGGAAASPNPMTTPTPTATPTSTPTATSTATPTLTATEGDRSSLPAGRGGAVERGSFSAQPASEPRPRKTSASRAATALVEVHVRPWGMLSVDGGPAKEVVVRADLALSPGRHTLRVERAGDGADEIELPLAAGEHRRWTPRLRR
jgi:tRNA A-37 threonylcarbamoyl transferase component Bud32